MKYLEEPVLEHINDALVFDTDDCKVFGRVEAYSCKNNRADNKLFKRINSRYADGDSCPQDENAVARSASPPSPEHHLAHLNLRNIVSPFGPLSQSSSRKTLFYLIATLNASFPDYDFSNVQPEQFVKQPKMSQVVVTINSTLRNVGGKGIIENLRLWDSIDNVIQLEECDVYSYIPDMDSDPYTEEGSIWSFNYFFYNRNKKRIVFFTVNAMSQNAPLQDGEDRDEYESSATEDIGAYADYVMDTMDQ